MVVVPDSEIRILKTPFEMNNTNQLTFSSATSQYNYFNSLPKTIYDGLTYIRQNGAVRYEGNFDDLLGYNYCMYQNSAYSNKWFYAYITDIEYISDEVTYLTIETDYFQTWQFDIIYKNSFVEREHVSNDAIGLHTIPEGLELGEYICSNKTNWNGIEFCFVVSVTEKIFGLNVMNNIKIPTGTYYIATDSLISVLDIINAYDTAGKGDAISSVFVYDRSAFGRWEQATVTITNPDGSTISKTMNYSMQYSFSSSYDLTYTRPNRIGTNYNPKNNKLWCFPYTYFQISNYNGQTNNYHNEKFNSSTYNFKLYGALTPSGSYKLVPQNYNNMDYGYDESINLGKFPIGSFNNDLYLNWQTQNGLNIATNMISNVGSAIIGTGRMMVGDIVGGANQVGSALNGITGTMSEIYQHSLMPDSVSGNVNNGDVNFQHNITGFEFRFMTIKNEYAIIIDNYFNAYGYKVNDFKIPNVTGRPNWNFVKCIDVNLLGDIPQKDMDNLRQMFNNGVTFWHNPNTFLDYSQNNK